MNTSLKYKTIFDTLIIYLFRLLLQPLFICQHADGGKHQISQRKKLPDSV